MTDISAFGLRVQVVASVTFPAGITLTEFADDADPFDLPSIQQVDKAMGLNGDLVTWSKASPINVTLNLVPGGADDQNMSALAASNRVGKGKNSAQDVITITAVYPSGRVVTLTQGKLTDAMPGNSVASAGRLKSKAYAFTFENVVEA